MNIQFSFFSVGVFAAGIILLVLGIYLLFKKEKSIPTKLLTGTFIGFSFLLVGYFFGYSNFNPNGAYHRYLTVCFTLFANASYGAFAYYYPRNDRPKEAKIVIFLVFLAAIIASIDFIFKTLSMEKIYSFNTHTYNFDYGGGTAIVILITQLVPFIVFVRKTIRYSEYSGSLNKYLIKPTSIIKYPVYIFFKFITGWVKFLIPIGKDSHSCQSFSKSILVLLSIAVCNVLNKNGILGYELYAFLFANLTLLACFYIFITYLNNSPEPTSFMVKLVGVSLVTTILVLGYVSNITINISEDDYDSERKAQIQGSKDSILERNYEKLPKEIEYILVKPASADIFEKSYTIEYNRTPDSFNQELISKGIDKFKEIGIKESLTKIYKDKKKNLSKEPPSDEELEEAVNQYKTTRQFKNIEKENSIELNRLYREAGKLFVHYDFIVENLKYEIGFNYEGYRKHTHKNVLKVILVILATVIIILIFFPSIFLSSLVKPLNDLLDGVTKVNNGDLNIEVPIKVQDEIGFLTGNFNSMVGSIKQARKELQDYADNLEAKVTERTREVQEKMEEVQKLKVQQDGDYFLTSLLAKPLFFNANKSKICETSFIIHQKKKFEFRNKTADLGGDICITGNLRFGTPNKNTRYTMILNGDAMGKSMQGAGGSLVMGVVINSIMSRSASNGRVLEMTPEQWLTDLYFEVNSVFKSFNGTMVISATVFLINDVTGEGFYFNAEHPFSILYRDGVANFIEDGLNLRKLGLDSEFEFAVQKFQFAEGDKLILASDGRDDIDLTPNEAVRTINDDETLVLKIVNEAKADIYQIEELILAKGNITDDLSILKMEFFGESKVDESAQVDLPELEKNEVVSSKVISDTLSEKVELEIVENQKNEIFGSNIINFYKEGKTLYQKGEVSKALEILLSAYSIDPNNQKLNKLLGLISFKGKDYSTAVDVLNKYLQQDPDTEEMWYYLSLSQKKLGNYLESLEASKKVFELKPTNVNNLVNLSDLFRLTGDFSESRKFSEKALEIEPTNQNAKKILQFLGTV